MIIGKLDAYGLKIKEVDISDNEPIFCEVCGKEVKGKSIGVKTEYPIHEMTKFMRMKCMRVPLSLGKKLSFQRR